MIHGIAPTCRLALDSENRELAGDFARRSSRLTSCQGVVASRKRSSRRELVLEGAKLVFAMRKHDHTLYHCQGCMKWIVERWLLGEWGVWKFIIMRLKKTREFLLS